MRAEDKLRVNWSKSGNDLIIHFPVGASTESDARFVSNAFSEQFTNELERRGYDITTLKFSVEPKKGNVRFASQRS